MEDFFMKKRFIIFIAVIIIPIFILILDRLVFDESEPLNSLYNQSSCWQFIAKNKEQYPSSLIKLASHNQETIPFVVSYPENYKKVFPLSLTEDLKNNQFPLLLQWDKRWGYKKYGKEFIAVNGAGPTCLSMVASYLMQNSFYNPYAIAQFAYQRGYYSEKGTSYELMEKGAKDLGIKVHRLKKDEQTLITALQQRTPIICSIDLNGLTSTQHFIVIKEYKDGLFYVHDPSSIQKSKGYTYQEIFHQIKYLWAYSV